MQDGQALSSRRSFPANAVQCHARRRGAVFAFGGGKVSGSATGRKHGELRDCLEATKGATSARELVLEKVWTRDQKDGTLGIGSCLMEGEAELTAHLIYNRAKSFEAIHSTLVTRCVERVGGRRHVDRLWTSLQQRFP